MHKSTFLMSLLLASIWLTNDQLAQRQFNEGDFKSAAETFEDPMWKGVAQYRAGDFKTAASTFATLNTPEAWFNQGNAWLLQGKYDVATSCYEQALEIKPDWKEAKENRDLAIARQKAQQQQGGDMGDQRLGADEIVFDRKKKEGGQETTVASNDVSSSADIQAMWLRQVQTNPADFLRSKFAFQYSSQSEPEK